MKKKFTPEAKQRAEEAGRFMEILAFSLRYGVPEFLLLHALPSDQLLELAKICVNEVEYREQYD